MTITSSPSPTRDDRRRGRSPVSYLAMRVLLFVLGVFGATAATYFGFVLDPAQGGIGNLFDLVVTLDKIGLSLVFLVVAVAPGLTRAQRPVLALWAMVAELVFDAVKLGYYRESTGWVFAVVDCLLLALVLRARRVTRPS